jgi:hypothetical protein
MGDSLSHPPEFCARFGTCTNTQVLKTIAVFTDGALVECSVVGTKVDRWNFVSTCRRLIRRDWNTNFD